MSPQPNACLGHGDSPKRPGARRSAMCLALAAVGALPASEAMAAVTRVVTTCADSTALPDCSTGDDCRSGVCHPDLDICIEECGDGLPECREPYVCGDVGGGMSACVPDEEGGCGCRSGGDDRSATAALFLFALLLVRRKRR